MAAPARSSESPGWISDVRLRGAGCSADYACGVGWSDRRLSGRRRKDGRLRAGTRRLEFAGLSNGMGGNGAYPFFDICDPSHLMRREVLRMRAKSFFYAEVRDRLFKRDPKCYRCRRRLAWHETTVDRRIPISLGGTNDDENFVLSCKLCNRDCAEAIAACRNAAEEGLGGQEEISPDLFAEIGAHPESRLRRVLWRIKGWLSTLSLR